MFRSARHRSPIAPRWVRGLLAGAFLAFVALNSAGCTLGAISYVSRNISPLHVTGWSIAWPIFPSQSQRLEEDIKREDRERFLFSTRFRRSSLRQRASTRRVRKRYGIRCPNSRTAARRSMKPNATTSES